jgi:EPS-associated MarR family transcriptional regulator|tara:strand:- start:255 stop:563 length:309 start_codon:yes stop_codon:yes gene_type:complete
MINGPDYLNILRKLVKNPDLNQRELATDLGLSLGKLNYCLKALRAKGLIKIKNFKNNKNKSRYLYILTPSGISHKTKLTLNFMKQRLKEYDELHKEIKSTEN